MAAYSLTSHFKNVYSHQLKAHDRLCKNPGNKSLHDYRVAAKQMDAFHHWILSLCSVREGDVLSRWFQQFRPLYKAGGKARNCHILLKIGRTVNAWEENSPDYLRLQQKYHRQSRKLKVKARRFRVPSDRAARKVLNTMVAMMPPHDFPVMLKHFICQRLSEAHALLNQPVNEQWHLARMLIKSSFFLMSDVNRLQTNLFSQELIDLCGMLEQNLGNWHDLDMLSQYLQLHDIQDASVCERIHLPMGQAIDLVQTRLALLNQLVAQLN